MNLVSMAEQRILRAERTIAEAERMIKLLEKFGNDEDYEQESVLVFYKKFTPAPLGKTYTYSAIKLDNRWFLSGPSQMNNKYSWVELIDFIVNQNYACELVVWRASDWERLV